MSEWTREQLLVALRLYLTEPFGKLHKTNPRIMALAKQIDRSAGALGMKACNFAGLDPTFVQSGRKGLANRSAADAALWAEYSAAPQKLIEEMEQAVEPVVSSDEEFVPTGPSEKLATVRVRRHQRFFRSAVESAYESACAVTGLSVSGLLVASHIVPWAKDEQLRSDPSNGLLLEPLFDRAFDRGYITFDDDHRLVCARRLERKGANASRLLDYRGVALRRPRRQPPSAKALSWHREVWFVDAKTSENPDRG